MTVLAPYREVLGSPGALAFSSAGFLARLPISMVGLGIVLLISHTTGSYARAGAVSAVFLLTNAVFAPVQARAADRIGQRRVLVPLVVSHALGLTVFLVAAALRAPAWVLVPAAGLAGATLPQIGALVRARWAARFAGQERLQTAYALESVLDEAIFVLGPVVVTAIATQIHPVAALGTTLVLTAGGGLILAALRETEPDPHPRRPRAVRARIPVAALGPLALGFACLGTVFGSIDVTVVAVTSSWGQRPMAGIALAAFATGSLVAGVAYGVRTWRISLPRRFVLFQAALAIVLLPLPFVGSLPLLVVFALLAGLAISPTLVTGFALVQEAVPPARLTEGLAWTSTSIGAGLALGAALSGAVVDLASATAGFWVCVAAGALGTALSGSTIRWSARSLRKTPRVPAWRLGPHRSHREDDRAGRPREAEDA